MMTILVRELNASTNAEYFIEIKNDSTVEQLQQEVANRAKVSKQVEVMKDSFRLIFKNTPLVAGKKLSDYNVDIKSVRLVLKNHVLAAEQKLSHYDITQGSTLIYVYVPVRQQLNYPSLL